MKLAAVEVGESSLGVERAALPSEVGDSSLGVERAALPSEVGVVLPEEATELVVGLLAQKQVEAVDSRTELHLVKVTTIRGESFCAFCDTKMLKGEVAVILKSHHAEGPISRNNGQKEGYCDGGVKPECLHPCCAFHWGGVPGVADMKRKAAKCRGTCQGVTDPDHRCYTVMGSPGARCTASNTGPAYYCYPCMGEFIQQHKELLKGYVSVSSQEADVAWKQPGLFGAGNRTLPSTNKEAYFALFRFDGDEDHLALERHRKQQDIIKAALKADKDIKNKKRKAGDE